MAGVWETAGARPGVAGPVPLLAVAIAVSCALGLLTALSGGSAPTGMAAPLTPAATGCAPSWGTAWLAAPQAVPGDPALGGATLRLIVRPQLTGSQVRLRLSNAYGDAPLRVGAASAGRSAGAAAVQPGSLQPVTFAGRPGAVLPAGGALLSDPVPLVAEAGRPLAVSLYLPTTRRPGTAHPVALQTSYLSRPGDHTGSAAGRPFARRLLSWPVLTGLDVLIPRPVNAVVAVGDSITDGFGGRPDTDQRWTDALAARLAAAGGQRQMAVLNAGLSANQLLADDPRRTGASPLTRFDRDVAAGLGGTDVVLNIGTNDIAAGRSAEEITAGLRRFAERARAAGKRVFLTTITPSRTGAHGTPAALATRDAVNAWVRRDGPRHADGVFDFAAAVADPAAPTRLARPFDSGDGLHLSAAGYRALAGAVDLAALTGSPCRVAGPAAERVVVSGH